MLPFLTVRVASVPTLHPSTLIPPVPCLSTFSATVPQSGLRATMIGSQAGFNAVPQPDHRRAASVAGAVMSSTEELRSLSWPGATASRLPSRSPIFSRSASAIASA